MPELKPFFEVDRAGLANLQARRGRGFAVLELLQNALDEQVSEVEVTLTPVPGRPYALLRVQDDSPSGFSDLSHAYTLFAPSSKTASPGQRGRFNLGEKLLLSLCEQASVQTTTGTVTFDAGGRREYPRRRRERGSVFEGRLRMTRVEYGDALATLSLVLVPAGVTVTVNGEPLRRRAITRALPVTLPTELAGEDGVMRRGERRCELSLVEPGAGERVWLYELGLPVMEIPGRWHLNVSQKVPMGMERDSVSGAYVRRVLAEVVAGAHDLMGDEDARSEWAGDALASGKLPSPAVDRIVTGRYGGRRVSADPSDPEGTKLAVSRDYQVIHSGAFSREQWRAVRAAGAVKPAGQVTPSPRPYSQDPKARLRRELPAGQMTDGMRAVKALSERLCRALLPAHVTVEVVFIADRAVAANATFGPVGARRCQLEFNVSRLGREFFDGVPARPEVLSLFVHETGHWYCDDHLSAAYHRALCDLAGRLAALALADPGLFGEVPDEPDAANIRTAVAR